MNNVIVSTKTTSTIFLSVILVAGTFAVIFPSFITGANAQAQPYPNGMDYNNYYKSGKDSNKNININKIKCINDNININGNNTGDINVGNKGKGYSGTYSSGVNGEGYNGYYDGYKKDKDFECIINNNNNNTNIVTSGGNITNGGDNATDGDGPDTVRTILSVSKNIGTCTPTDNSQNAIDACAAIETEILPNLYTLSITDNILNPTLVEGSEVPVDVTVNPGDYLVAEIGTSALQTAIANIGEEFTVDIFPLFSVTGDCSLAPGGAGGTITEGGSETCNLVNSFEVEETAG